MNIWSLDTENFCQTYPSICHCLIDGWSLRFMALNYGADHSSWCDRNDTVKGLGDREPRVLRCIATKRALLRCIATKRASLRCNATQRATLQCIAAQRCPVTFVEDCICGSITAKSTKSTKTKSKIPSYSKRTIKSTRDWKNIKQNNLTNPINSIKFRRRRVNQVSTSLPVQICDLLWREKLLYKQRFICRWFQTTSDKKEDKNNFFLREILFIYSYYYYL